MNGPVAFCGQGSVINNAQYIAFIAGSTDITLYFNVSNCSITSQGEGLQIVIFGHDDCSDDLIRFGPCLDSGGDPTAYYHINGYGYF